MQQKTGGKLGIHSKKWRALVKLLQQEALKTRYAVKRPPVDLCGLTGFFPYSIVKNEKKPGSARG